MTFAWGPNVLIYNTQKVEPAPQSWDVLFEPEYTGRIALPDNPMTIADVALWLGKDDPYNLTDADERRSDGQNQERDLRRSISTFTDGNSE